ncbi:hypothetical protein KCG44_05170 [Pacificimonas sp. WHA3]|uniref:Lipoprotein n=1 Tax=Pacificimonas pallii TaxID=2827236 RepID=A0ABS6SE91_9SPHN|nr:hypothetical protein [Pacificimonas pallii]MBV7256172.1 hypothetical protein [Pacificimonas pallii]
MRSVILLSSTAALLAACAVTPAPPPPPPPPVVAKADLAPPDAYYFNYALPARDASGTFASPNINLTEQEAIFHLRSALNVAALSCRKMEGMDMTDNYNTYIRKYRLTLAKANRTIDARYAREVDGGKRARDAHMTSLYNHFARPATLGTFCPMALKHLNAAIALPDTTAAITDYSQTAVREIEDVFQQHYASIEQYQIAYRQAMRDNGQTPPPMATVALEEQVGSPGETLSPDVAAAIAKAAEEADRDAAAPIDPTDVPQPN